jgi:hypothetical protein
MKSIEMYASSAPIVIALSIDYAFASFELKLGGFVSWLLS